MNRTTAPPPHRSAGIAALVAAATFVFGFALYASLLAGYTTGDPTPRESVAFLVDHQLTFQVWNLVIYLVFGVALVVLVIGLHHLTPEGSLLASVSAAFGLIWAGLVLATGMVANIGIGRLVDLHADDPARAEPVWSALDAVQDGLGGGNEVVGGVWVLTFSWLCWRARVLPRLLSVVGGVVGVAGAATAAPGLSSLGAVFGLGLIVWFVWLAFALLRQQRAHRPAPPEHVSHGSPVAPDLLAPGGSSRVEQ